MVTTDNKNRDTASSGQAISAALEGFSIEMGSHQAKSLDEVAERMPQGTDVFLNLFPNDQLERQIDICRRILAAGFTPIPHLAARRARALDDVRRILGRFTSDAGVRDFLIIAGDLEKPASEITDAVEFIRLIRSNDFGIRRIGISGYPEGHPLISDQDLERTQQEKIAILEDLDIEPVVVTQFSFEPDAIIRYCKAVHARHPDIHIKNGLPGPAKLTTLIRFAQRCGVKSSMRKMKALPVSASLKLLQRVPPTRQAEALGEYKISDNSNVSLHLFTFGGVPASLDWIDEALEGDTDR
ncbi:MAG: methylenetetrahydrofolate reductase [Woeseiaceae bacterium]|nr:methylenetetrahydrofolate reductase [Woeseiaceae bacterium]